MKELLEQLIRDQNQLTEIDWRRAAGGALIAANLLTAIPNVAQAAVPKHHHAQAEDKHIVAKVIAGEAAGEGYTGMKAVACVIQNRGGKPVHVVKKPHQFSAISDPKMMDRNYAKVKKEADELASQIGKLDDITGGAKYYLTKEVYDKKMALRQSWVKNLTYIKQIGNHVFLK